MLVGMGKVESLERFERSTFEVITLDALPLSYRDMAGSCQPEGWPGRYAPLPMVPDGPEGPKGDCSPPGVCRLPSKGSLDKTFLTRLRSWSGTIPIAVTCPSNGGSTS